MPRTATNLTHVTFPADPASASLGSIRVHPSKGAALEYAVEEGVKYAPVRPGESLADAIARYASERAAARPKLPAGGVAPIAPKVQS